MLAKTRSGDEFEADPLVHDRGTQALVADLLEQPESSDRNVLVLRALMLHYHDECSPYLFPEISLIRHLHAAGFFELIQRAVRGAYDQPEAA